VRRPSTLLSFTIAVSLISASVPLSAHAGTLELAPEAAEDPALAEARSLYKEGEIKFETADYEEALTLWKRAFAILPDGEETRTMRHALVYNIAEAHSRAYEISRNPTHLRKAKILLENYRADHRALYGDEPEAVKERTEVDDRIAELDKKIAASEAAGEAATPLGDGDGDTTTTTTAPPGPQQQPVPQPQQKPLTPTQQWERDVKADPQLGPMWEKGGKQVGGGAVLVGIGGFFTLGAAGLAVYGSYLRSTTNDGFIDLNGNGSFASAGVFGVIGLSMLIPGAVLLASGVSKRNKVKQARPRPGGTLYPTMIPRGAGVGYTLQF
jgi:tetratricopeptide (TPR) repeat protein